MKRSTWMAIRRRLMMGLSPRLLKIAGQLLTAMFVVTFIFILLGFVAAEALDFQHEVADIAKSLADAKTTAVVVVFALTTAFGVAAYIWKTELDRATLLRELTTKLYTDPGLYGAYNELVYNYPADTYYEVAEAIETNVKRYGDSLKLPIFRGAEAWQYNAGKTLEPGKRRFHPFFFQGSPEEARLDALLNYLELVAYHIEKDHLTEDEIGLALNELLTTIAKRPFITEYLLYVSNQVDLKASPNTGSYEGLYKLLNGRLDVYRSKSNDEYGRDAVTSRLYHRDRTRKLYKDGEEGEEGEMTMTENFVKCLRKLPQADDVRKSVIERISAQSSVPVSPGTINKQGELLLCLAARIAEAGLLLKGDAEAAERFCKYAVSPIGKAVVSDTFDRLGWPQALCDVAMRFNDRQAPEIRRERILDVLASA
jgi:hypothetical protein